MTFEQLQINAGLKTTDIKGKAYVEVNERIKAFRMLYPNGSIETEIIKDEDGACTIKATVKDEEGRVLASDHAQEKEGSTFINKTSYIENCSTSATGRALGLLGIGIDTCVASYEEVQNAINNQDKISSNDVKALKDLAKIKTIEMAVICRKYGVETPEDLNVKQWLDAVGRLRK
jgi:hypothetical protein